MEGIKKSRNYTIRVISGRFDTTYKPFTHLRFTLGWGKQFWNVVTQQEPIEVGDECVGVLYGEANWWNRIHDMKNFSTYYKRTTFVVVREDDKKTEIYENGNYSVLETV